MASLVEIQKKTKQKTKKKERKTAKKKKTKVTRSEVQDPEKERKQQD